MIRRIYFVGIMCLFAVISLLNMSGFGTMIGTDNLFRYVICFFAVFTFFILQKKNKKIANVSDVFLILFAIIVFEGSSVLGGYAGSGLIYLAFYICVYLIAMQEFKNEYLFYTSMIFMCFGTGLLLLLKYTNFLFGWNPNTLSIICFQSFMVFFATFNVNSVFKRLIYYFIVVVNVVLLEILGCRSAIFCIIFTVFCEHISFLKKLLTNKLFILFFLLLPLIISVSITLISNLPIAQKLNEWSIEVFSKGIFNGRDVIWNDGFGRVMNKPFIGHGFINSGYWHNSAVACLYSYGLIGYSIYIVIFFKILNCGRNYIEDVIVKNCIFSFLIINFQQSFENTIFIAGGIYIPYVILGVLLGRIRYLKGIDLIEKNQYCCTYI